MVYKCCVVCDFCGEDIFTRQEPAKSDWMRGQAHKIGAGFYKKIDGESKDICRKCDDLAAAALAATSPKKDLVAPKEPGFYWGQFVVDDDHDEKTAVWQVMHVVITSDEVEWPENLGAMVPGIVGTYGIENFIWSPGLVSLKRPTKFSEAA